MVTALAVVLPIGFVAAIAARREMPLSATWQPVAAIADEDAITSGIPGSIGSRWIPLEGSADFGLHWKSGRAVDGSGRILALWPQQDPRRPQVLVYRTEQHEDGDELPEDARLLGTLAGTEIRRFPIADASLAFDGSLILYSLGHQQVIGHFRLPAAQGAGTSSDQE